MRIRPSVPGFGLQDSSYATAWAAARAARPRPRPEPAYQRLGPEVRVLAERSEAEIAPGAAPLVATFRFLAALAAVRLGVLRPVWRGERRGRPVLVVASVEDGSEYEVDDPQLGEAEAAAVDALLGAPGGGLIP